MGAKNFVNQFKNTRRQVKIDFGKNVKSVGRPLKKPHEGQRPGKNHSGPKGK